MENRQSIKREYSENEAAAALGLSVPDLRSLVREHILSSAKAGAGQPDTYLAAEVIVLKILASQRSRQAAAACAG